MSAPSIDKKNYQVFSFWGFGLVLIFILFFGHGVEWRGNSRIHTIMEAIATLLAAVTGLMALVRYYSRKNVIYLFVGVGFLGTAFLDGYHAVVTSIYFKMSMPTDLPHLISWSGMVPRLFLSVMLFLSWVVWRQEKIAESKFRIDERKIYVSALAFTLASFVFFATVRLPAAYIPDQFIGRPDELLPALIFGLALVGYLRKSYSQDNHFEYWLVLSLMVGLISEAFFMSHSSRLFDYQFDLAHVLKKISYICVLIGLLISMFVAFRHADETGKVLADNVRELEFQKFAIDEHSIVSITDVKGNITYANDQFCEISEYSRREIVGKNHRLIKSDEHSPEVFKELWKTISKGDTWRGELKNRKKNGGYYWVDATIVPFMNEDGKPFQYVGIRTDITEIKDAQAIQFAQTKLVRTLLGLTRVSNEASNIDDAVQICLTTICHHIGWPIGHAYILSDDQPDVLVSSSLWHLDDPKRYVSFRNVTEKTNFDIGIGLPGRVLKSHEIAWIEDISQDPNFPRISHIHDNQLRGAVAIPVVFEGKVWAVLEFFSEDVAAPESEMTEVLTHAGNQLGQVFERLSATKTLKKNVDALAKLSEEHEVARSAAEAASLAKSDFLSAMSHEIRTPMAGIIGMSELLLETDLSPEQLDRAVSIKNSGRNLLTILNEILDQSKLEAGKLDIDPINFHLSSLVEDTTELFVPKIDEKGIHFEVLIEEKLPDGVYADRMRIGQILSNLLSNALKFTEKGHISVKVDADGPITKEFMLRFSISDSGIGLSENARDALFSPFVQADSSTSRTYGGTGLGLSISKQLAELMGGQIGVTSKKGEGSTFWFTVKCSEATGEIEITDKRQALDRWHASRSLNVLVAEDNAVNQKLIESIFQNLSHKVTIAENGHAAIDLVEEEDFDVILMDVRMPVMDGLQATTHIRERRGDKANLPIIALTADISAGNIEEYLESGMDGVCAKPIELPDLLKTINAQVGEEIHTSVPQAPLSTSATADVDDHEVISHDGNFSKVLERVASIADQTAAHSESDNGQTEAFSGLDQDKFSELVSLYEVSLIEQCETLVELFSKFEKSPEDDKLREELKGLTHSFKGGGGSFGYQLISIIAAVADEILKSDKVLEAAELEVLCNHIDAMVLVADKKLSGHGGKAGRLLLDGLPGEHQTPRSR
jgi:PAS domain S-box-containing protein